MKVGKGSFRMCLCAGGVRKLDKILLLFSHVLKRKKDKLLQQHPYKSSLAQTVPCCENQESSVLP